MKRGLRIVLLMLLAALLAGFVAGTVIRLRFERPVQYLGFQPGGATPESLRSLPPPPRA